MKSIKILDGGFSTQLSKYVGDKIDGDPLWTARFLATNPDAVYKTHLDFLQAGADIIETNTYQASIPGLMKHLNINEEESINLIHTAVNLAKKAVETFKQNDNSGRAPMIAGSCGPYGACLSDCSEYTGSYGKSVSRELLMDWHRPRVKALLNAGVDLIALETIPCIEEAEAVINLLREFPNAKAWVSFSCQPSTLNLADGSDFAKVATNCHSTAIPEQIVAVGINCLTPEDVIPLLKAVNGNKKVEEFIPMIVYPNSGEKYSKNQGWMGNVNHLPLASLFPECLHLGVKYIGGCCRWDADDISKLRKEVEKYVEASA